MEEVDHHSKPVVVVTGSVAAQLASYPPSEASRLLTVTSTEHIASSAPAAAFLPEQGDAPSRFEMPAPQSIDEELKLERTVREDIERMKAAGIGMQ